MNSKKRTKQSSLLSWIGPSHKKEKKETATVPITLLETDDNEAGNQLYNENILDSKDNNGGKFEKEDVSLLSSTASTSINVESGHIMDIGRYVNVSVRDLHLKEKLLSEPWFPPVGYTFPTIGKRNLRFQPQWCTQFSWLVYSELLNGALCKYCVLFSNECAGKGGHVKVGALVSNSFFKWKDALEVFRSHSTAGYHKRCIELADNFLDVQKGARVNVVKQIDTGFKQHTEENRNRLRSIVDTIIMMGRQEISLRGTNDSGPLLPDAPEPLINDGNFRAILRMRVKCGDLILKHHIDTAPSNAVYTSPDIQNEIIYICGKIIQDSIVKRVNSSKCFTILADETTDISRVEQLSLCVRYIDNTETNSESKLREDFLQFIPVIDASGRGLAGTILEALINIGINLNFMYGQGYDGAAAMSGKLNGVQAVIKERFPQALYIHCSAHSLNLAIGHCCQVPAIRNCIGTVTSVGNFVRASAQRTNILKENILKKAPASKRTTLTAMCDTRWVENHNALLRFVEIYNYIVHTLEEIEESKNSDTSSKASRLLNTITQSEFVISLCAASELFALTLPLCKVLQKVDCDLSQACEHILNITNVISHKREHAEEEFQHIFTKSLNMLSTVNSEISVPRINSRQTHRANMPSTTPEEYFRRSVYIPFLDDFINQLEERFNNKIDIISSLHKCIPKYCVQANFCDIEPCIIFYIKDYSSADNYVVKAEFSLWKSKWCILSENIRPSNALSALNQCSPDFFPTMGLLLKILATLPVSTATPERTFSTLKRLKTFLRNGTSQDRLVGLALMCVHRDINVDTESVIARFAQLPRKINFAI